MKHNLILVALTVMSVCCLVAPTTYGANLQDVRPTATTPGPQTPVSYDQRIQVLENQIAGLQAGPHADSPCGCECNCCSSGWFATMDYLNWQIERNDLGYAILDPGGTGVPAGGQPVRSLDLGPQSGFRVALGRRTLQGWELGVRYSNMRAEDNQSFAPGASQVLAVQSSPATGLTNANSVSASSEFRYDVFDLQAGHWFDPCDTLSMLVLGGVRFSSIDHRLRVRYDGGAFIDGLIDVPTNVDAFGLRMGSELHWNVTPGLNLFGRTAISANATDISASRRETNAGAVVIDASRPSHPVVPEMELALGVRYFSGNWSLAAGYEFENWFNLVSPLEFSDNFNGGTLGPSQRDLGLHGMFFNLAYAY